MRTRTPNPMWLLAVALVLGGGLLPMSVAAQSDLDVAQAREFLGNWNVLLQSEMGPLPLTLQIEDEGGKVAVEFGSDQGTQEVENVVRSDDSLVLTFVTDAQGQAIDVVINLQREGEELRAAITAMGGAFVASGVATRAES